MSVGRSSVGKGIGRGMRCVAPALLAVAVFLLLGMGSTARADSGTPSRERAVALSRTAYAAFSQGDVETAFSDYKGAEHIFRTLAGDAPSDPQAQRDLAVINERLGDVLVRMNQGAKAHLAYSRNLSITERLYSADADDVRLLQDLIVGSLKLGDLSVWLAKAEQAAAAYEKGVAYCERLPGIAPGNIEARRNLCLLWYRQGSLLRKVKLADKAEAARRHELAARDVLLAADPDKGEEVLFTTYKRLGEHYGQVGQRADAIAVFQESLGMADQLVRKAPGNLRYRWELSSIYKNLGELHAQQGQFDSAAAAYGRVLDIAVELAKAAPGDLDFRRDIVVTHYKLGGILEAKGSRDSALKEYESALAFARPLAEANTGNDQLQRDVAEISQKIDDLKR